MTSAHRFAGLLILRALIQRRNPGEENLHWALDGVGITEGGERPRLMAGVFGDLFLQTAEGWECGASAVIAVEDWPPPDDQDSYQDAELDSIKREVGPLVEELLWDACATTARQQAALVGTEIDLPTYAPAPRASDAE